METTTALPLLTALVLASCAGGGAAHDASTPDAHVTDLGVPDAALPDTGALRDGECWMTRPAAMCGDGVCDPGCESPAVCAADCVCTSSSQCAPGMTCDATYHCACVPSCAGRSCGDDGCGGSCGACGGGTGCTAAGQCELCTFHTDCTSCSTDGNYCGWCGATSRCIHTMDASGASVCSGGWAWTPAAC